MKQTKSNQWTTSISIAKLLLLLLLLIAIPILLIQRCPQLLSQFRNIEALNTFLDRYKMAGGFIYVGLQILQIMIPVIPGQALQLAAGYMYHFFPGLFLSLLGIGLGTVISFTIARVLGHDAMVLLFGQERVQTFVRRLNSKRAYLIIFLLYLMPGFPKDFICFAAGVSEIRLVPFLILSLVGRTPALALSILIGNMTRVGSYSGALVAVAAAALLFVLFFWKRKALMALCDDMYERFSREDEQ